MMEAWGEVKEPAKTKPTAQAKEPESVIEQVGNRVYFYNGVNQQSIVKLNKALREQSNRILTDAKTQGIKHPPPIYLHLNTYGGAIFAGLAAMDEILKCEVDVFTVIDGCCASAGTFMSIVGKKCYIHKHAFMLIHQLSSSMWGDV